MKKEIIKRIFDLIFNQHTLILVFCVMSIWMVFEAVYYIRHEGEFYMYHLVDKWCDRYEEKKRKRRERKNK